VDFASGDGSFVSVESGNAVVPLLSMLVEPMLIVDPCCSISVDRLEEAVLDPPISVDPDTAAELDPPISVEPIVFVEPTVSVSTDTSVLMMAAVGVVLRLVTRCGISPYRGLVVDSFSIVIVGVCVERSVADVPSSVLKPTDVNVVPSIVAVAGDPLGGSVTGDSPDVIVTVVSLGGNDTGVSLGGNVTGDSPVDVVIIVDMPKSVVSLDVSG